MARIGFLSHADMSQQRNDTNYRFVLANHLGRISAKFQRKFLKHG
ncbi:MULTISPECIES: hypothetical protein [unclassified Campylobacter]